MSKLINIKDYIRVSSYAKKYGIIKKKIYRYVDAELIDYIYIDDILLIKDVQYTNLEIDHRTKNALSIVSSMTLDSENHGMSITQSTQIPDFQDDSNVSSVTKGNVSSVTLQLDEIMLLLKNEKECSSFEFGKIKEIKEKYNL